jgi:hypothetical protein
MFGAALRDERVHTNGASPEAEYFDFAVLDHAADRPRAQRPPIRLRSG